MSEDASDDEAPANHEGEPDVATSDRSPAEQAQQRQEEMEESGSENAA